MIEVVVNVEAITNSSSEPLQFSQGGNYSAMLSTDFVSIEQMWNAIRPFLGPEGVVDTLLNFLPRLTNAAGSRAGTRSSFFARSSDLGRPQLERDEYFQVNHRAAIQPSYKAPPPLTRH
jgi:hypothetical protein